MGGNQTNINVINYDEDCDHDVATLARDIIIRYGDQDILWN